MQPPNLGNKSLHSSCESIVSPRGSRGQVVVKNPVYGKELKIKSISYDSIFDKPLRQSWSGKEVSQAIEKVNVLNERVIKHVQASLQTTSTPIPCPTLCNFTLLKFVGDYILENPPVKIDRQYCRQLRQTLYVDKVFTRLITDRISQVSATLKDFMRENGTTEWINEVCTYLMKMSVWQPIEMKKQLHSKGGVEEFGKLSSMSWSDKDVDNSIKVFLINVVYGSEEDFNEFQKWNDKLGANSQLLTPLINYLKDLVILKESTKCNAFSCNLQSETLSEYSVESILRNYIPQGLQIHRRISLANGTTFTNNADSGSVLENQRNFFSALFSAFNYPIDVQKEVDDLLSGNKECSLLPILGAGTIECWSLADRMLRLLYPGLFSAPFLMKTIQGTELDINLKSLQNFSVTQHKMCQIKLRVNPVNPTCLIPQENYLCEIPVSWTISCKEGNVILGTLAVGDILFSKEATAYEKGEINQALGNPQQLPENWRTAEFPQVTRSFNFL